MAQRTYRTGLTLGAVIVCALAAEATAHADLPHDVARRSAPDATLMHTRAHESAGQPVRMAQNKRSGKKGKKGGACKKRCFRSVSGCQDIATAMRSSSDGYRDLCRAAVRACTRQC